MIKYRNVRHGRVVERPTEDEWLEASAGWERVNDADEVCDYVPDPEMRGDEPAEDDERNDD